MDASAQLTVAVTGPTGEIGGAFVRALDRSPAVARIVGMARRPFDPSEQGLTKLEYMQGDITDRAACNKLVAGADVVVHLAFIIFGKPDEAREINLQGARNVFEATFEAGARRLVYTSSVAAYGFHEDNPLPLKEDIPARGTEDHPYSLQKAEVETLLANLARAYSDTDVYVFRPCIVAGPSALALITKLPFVQLGDKLPNSAKKFVGGLPMLRPVLPDPGVPFQLVHEDDVAQALLAAVHDRGTPGIYNLAAEGAITVADLAHALGWYSIPIPDIALDAAARIVSKLPLMPVEAKWVDALRVPVTMDTLKARAELSWHPQHDALDTLADTVVGARDKGLLPWPDRV